MVANSPAIADQSFRAFFTRVLAISAFWSIAKGRETVTIADRPYFKAAMAGKTVVAEMVRSRTTGRPVANIACR